MWAAAVKAPYAAGAERHRQQPRPVDWVVVELRDADVPANVLGDALRLAAARTG
jgi:hypothetical protein